MLSLRGHADALVVRRVLKGERDEFGVLVNRYLPVVHAVAYAHTGNRTDAEDAVQDGFLSAFEKLATLREAHKFGSWLIAIVRNACRERHKTEVRRNALMEKADLPAAVASPDMVRRELHDMLHQQMDQLDAAHREVLLMHYFAGMRVGEIAALLGASPAAVRKRLQRARDVLSKQMLRQMRPELELETRRDRTRAARIMGIIAAAPAPWQAAVTPGATSAAMSAATTLGGVLIVKKVIIAIVVVLAGILGVWTLTREGPQEEWPAATETAPTEVGVSGARTG